MQSPMWCSRLVFAYCQPLQHGSRQEKSDRAHSDERKSPASEKLGAQHNVRTEFEHFAGHCKTTTSNDSDITCRYSLNRSVYELADEGQTIFAYSWERSVSSEITAPNIANFTLYVRWHLLCYGMLSAGVGHNRCHVDRNLHLHPRILRFCLLWRVHLCLEGRRALGRRHTTNPRSPSHQEEPSL